MDKATVRDWVIEIQKMKSIRTKAQSGIPHLFM